MEDGFQDGLQIPFDDFLCDSVADRWDTQRPGPSIALGKVNPPHWRRKVAPRGHPIPEPVEVVRKINLKLGNRLSVYSSRSLVGLHLLEGFPDFPLRDVERLCVGHRAPPVTGWLWVAAEQCSPFDPAPLQSFPLYYELLRPCAPHRYSDPCGSSHSDVSLCIGATGSHVPYKSLIRLRAAYVPDVARAVFRTAPELIPGARRPPGFDIAYGISTLHQRFACARLSGSHLTGSCPPFAATLTTIALDDRSLQGFEAAPDRWPRGACPHLSYSTTPPPSEACS